VLCRSRSGGNYLRGHRQSNADRDPSTAHERPQDGRASIAMREFGKRVVLGMLRGYKWAISPMFPPACRFVPTCSEYAMEAVERFGALRGGWMAVGRVLRCHPLARSGHDPVVRRESGARGEGARAVVETTFEGAGGIEVDRGPSTAHVPPSDDHALLRMTDLIEVRNYREACVERFGKTGNDGKEHLQIG
jgi:putative membrane protein insertion efficiency factor